MSKLPKVPKVPRPASKVSHEQASTEAHEMLLRLVWQHIDDLVSARFSSVPVRVLDEAPSAIAKHTEETTSIINALERHVKGDRLNAEIKSSIKHYIPLCMEYAKKAPPKLEEDAEALQVTVENTTLERPIVETKGRRGEERTEQIGFIDLECQIRIPVRAEIDCGIPYSIRSFTSTYGSLFEDRLKKGDPFENPQWSIVTEQRLIWIDIRPELPAVGQLLRELKTLRTYAGTRSFIWVFTEAVDPEIADMLHEEGFLISDRDWIENILASLED